MKDRPDVPAERNLSDLAFYIGINAELKFGYVPIPHPAKEVTVTVPNGVIWMLKGATIRNNTRASRGYMHIMRFDEVANTLAKRIVTQFGVSSGPGDPSNATIGLDLPLICPSGTKLTFLDNAEQAGDVCFATFCVYEVKT